MTRAENEIWVEKFRPQTLDELIGNNSEVNRLKDWVDDPSMPNVMFWGPQGTGKTAAAQAFAQDKYGDDWKNHMMEMNASDERGIETVRKKIKSFASQGGVMGEHDFNIVMLDEVDQMTRDAQPAMRRVMEDYHDRTRFFLICNYPNQLIDPIKSRTAKLHMSPLSVEQTVRLLRYVADEEGLEYTDAQLQTIAEQSEGDARTAIHTLQSSQVDGEVLDEYIDVVTTIIDEDDVRELVDLAISEQQEEAMAKVDELLEQGIDPQALCDEMMDIVLERDDLPRDSWSLLVDKIADCEWRILHGSRPGTQLRKLVTDLQMARHISYDPYRNQDNE